MLVHRSRVPLNFDGVCTARGCRRTIIPGRAHCARHTRSMTCERRKSWWRDSAIYLLLRPPSRPLAAWLSDPSLLPKRPPGANHKEISQ